MSNLKEINIKQYEDGGDLATDVIGFIQEAKGLSFKDAINYVRNFV